MKRVYTALLMVVSLFFAAQQVQAVTITVDTNIDQPVGNPGTCSLRQAIQAANTNAADGNCPAGEIAIDEIVFADPNQVFNLTIPPAGMPNDNVAGDLVICGTTSITGAGPDNTTIRANFPGTPDRVLSVLNTQLCFAAGSPIVPGLLLEGVTVENGNTETPILGSSLIGGGGIFNLSTLLINNSVIQNNNASNPGMETSTFVRGAGILNGGALAITDSTIQGNIATSFGSTSAPDARGGGIANMDTNQFIDQGQCSGLALANTSITNNTVNRGNGGGVSNEDCLELVANSAVYQNQVLGEVFGTSCGTTTGNGGGISNIGVGNPSQTAFFVFVNSTLSENSAVRSGGGLFDCNEEMGPAQINSATVVNNTAGVSGGGIFHDSQGVGSDRLQLMNTILANNSAATGPDCANEDASEPITSIGYNLIRDPSDCTIDGAQTDDLPAGTDPTLGDLVNNGGLTPTHALLVGSPAIDTANPAGCEVFNNQVGPLEFDQRDDPFARVIAGVIGGTPRCDIGAYEFEPTEIATSKTASNGTVEVNDNFVYTISVTNSGPGQATGVTINDPLPAGVVFVSFGAISQGSCAEAAGIISCDIGSLPVSQTATVDVNVQAVASGTVVNTATITTNETEPQNPSVTVQITQSGIIQGSGLLPCSLQRGEVPAHVPFVLFVFLGSVLTAFAIRRVTH